MKILSISIVAGLTTLLLWIALIWLASENLLAEGPDTRTAMLLAKPIEWWASFVSPVTTALLDATGLRHHWGGIVIGFVIWLGPIVALLSAGWLPIVRRYIGVRAPLN